MKGPVKAVTSVHSPEQMVEEGAALIGGYGEFEVDIEEVLRSTLPPFFKRVAPARLTPENVALIPPRAKGAYLLFHKTQKVPVYAGKTDTRHGFRDRLGRHAFTVRGRKNLDPEDMWFKAARVLVFSALDIEALLIAEMRRTVPGSLSWNNSGFGSNDPGRNRDGQEPASFDQQFPVDLDFEVEFPVNYSKLIGVNDALAIVRQQLPYILRFGGISPLVSMVTPKGTVTARQVLTAAMEALPSGYQVTVLHGRVIIYKEDKVYDYSQEYIES